MSIADFQVSGNEAPYGWNPIGHDFGKDWERGSPNHHDMGNARTQGKNAEDSFAGMTATETLGGAKPSHRHGRCIIGI